MSQTARSLIGNWQMLRAELNGEPAPELVTSNTELEFTATTYAVRYAGTVMDRGTYETGSGDTPRTLVLRGVEGTNQGRTIPCVYQLAGRRLRIAFGLDGRAPQLSKNGNGSQHYSATYGAKSEGRVDVE